MKKWRVKAIVVAGVCCLGAICLADSLLGLLSSPPTMVATTIPPIGDVNPYGIAFVPPGFHGHGDLHPGDLLVSNFNNGANLQGTGNTIVRIDRDGETSVFFQGHGLGLTTALGVLKNGFVIVGNVPTKDGTSGTIKKGNLIVLNSDGQVVHIFANPTLLDGPWDLTVHQDENQFDDAQVFVSNVLSGTVTRLDLQITKDNVFIHQATQIGSGYLIRTDPAALVVGPTGLAYDDDTDQLYVAATGDNAIYRIDHAGARHSDVGKGFLVYADNAHLRGPLGLVLAPNGHLITTNGDAVNGDPTQPSEMVEFTKTGHFVMQVPVNSSGQGGAFGIAVTGHDSDTRFAAVDDILNQVDVWRVHLH